MSNLPTVIVLAGGLGTRLQSVLSNTPKILAPISGKPFVDFFIRWCESKGITKLHFCLGKYAEQVVEHLSTVHSDRNITWQIENQPLGTGGAIKLALNKLNENNELLEVLICNGDTFVDFDVDAFISECEEGVGGMVTTFVNDASRYGMIDKGSNGQLINFQEKSSASVAGEINAGWYYLQQAHIKEICDMPLFSFEKEYLMNFNRLPIKCVQVGNDFLDFGTPNSYEKAQNMLRGLK